MPRVKQVVAAKDYPKFGIVKGQKHYHWKRKTGPRSSQEYRQVEPPRIEQLTSSSFRIAIHHIEKQRDEITDPSGIDDLITAVEELAAEQREKFDNMPEGLQQGDTGQTLEQQADTLDAAAEEFGTIRDEWQEALDNHETEVSNYEVQMLDYNAAMEAHDDEDEEDEPEEPEDPGEFDADEYTGRLGDVQLEP
jgi:hypothetical protein